MNAPADLEPPPADPGFDPGWDTPFLISPWVYLQHPSLLFYQPLGLLFPAFWLWMLIHCARHDPDRGMWLWILFIGNVPAALVYFVVRWLPGARVATGSSVFKRWTKRRQIPRLESAARSIGNAHQFVELGEAYRETGKYDQAADCFSKALQKDAESLPALWGAAQVEMHRQNHSAAITHLDRILVKDGSYKFGDVSLACCRTLYALNESEAAREKLLQHLKRWTHPEAYVLLATIEIGRGDRAAARQHLESTLMDLHGGPAFFARQNRGWARKAKRLLRRLPKE
jgi:hypothetical protein